MTLHTDEFDPRQGVIHERTVLVSKLGTAHRAKNTGVGGISSHNNTAILSGLLFQPGGDDLGEAVSGAVEARLHRAEVGIGDLGDLFVRFPFKLPQHKYVPVVFWELFDSFFDLLADISLVV